MFVKRNGDGYQGGVNKMCRFVSADFFQLLFVCGQWHVFWVENNAALRLQYGGGSNTRISSRIDGTTENPTDDFTSYKEYVSISTPLVVSFRCTVELSPWKCSHLVIRVTRGPEHKQ